MSKFADIKKGLSNYELLERELTLKQLQINRLLDITQAINNNLVAADLFKMYSSFLSWEMGVRRMALYVKGEDGNWTCASSVNIPPELLALDIAHLLPTFDRLNNIKKGGHPLIDEFEVVVPVTHKKQPIAYAFIGGFDENDDMYNKVQFITTITNIIAVAIENKRLFKQQLEQERLRKEMELASAMQSLLVPDSLPCNNQYELASIYKPHLDVGGDYLDFIDYENDPRFMFCIGDISGKGLAAALLMANFQANVHALIRGRVQALAFIKELNRAVLKAARGEKFITFFIAEFNLETRKLIYINAGHTPPILFTKGKIEPLNKGCTILGSFAELPEIEVGEMFLDEESLIFAHTDGLTDIQNPAGHYLSDQQLHDFIRNNAQLPTARFNAQLTEYVDAFRQGEALPDDFSVLTCKIFK
jgi:sigma-B regulation protein RsbU (phosphoserine phosphatase)